MPSLSPPPKSPSPKRKAKTPPSPKSPKKVKAKGERNIGDAMAAEVYKKLRLSKPDPFHTIELEEGDKESAPRAKPKLRVDTALAAAMSKGDDISTLDTWSGMLKDLSAKTQGGDINDLEASEDGIEVVEPLQTYRPGLLTPETLQRRRAEFFNSPDYDATMPAPSAYDEHIEFLYGKPRKNERSPSPPLGSEGHHGDQTMTEDPTIASMDVENDEMFPGSENAATPPASDPLSPPGNAAPLAGDGASDFKTPASTNISAKESSGKAMVDEKSGYTWTNDEDAPGYAWKNRRAQEEANRAWNTIVGKDQMIGRRFGDIGSDEDRKKWT